MSSLAEKINQLLPQTQCGECDFKGCQPYALAMSEKKAEINRCVPGGVKTLQALGQLLSIDAKPYEVEVEAKTRPLQLASIRESECIGCTKCIQACPIDAIIGTAKHMHTIISHECTGCGLCMAPCPVDCIDLVPVDALSYEPETAKKRHEEKERRSKLHKKQKVNHYETQKVLTADAVEEDNKKAKQAYILEAMARIQQKKLS